MPASSMATCSSTSPASGSMRAWRTICRRRPRPPRLRPVPRDRGARAVRRSCRRPHAHGRWPRPSRTAPADCDRQRASVRQRRAHRAAMRGSTTAARRRGRRITAGVAGAAAGPRLFRGHRSGAGRLDDAATQLLRSPPTRRSCTTSMASHSSGGVVKARVHPRLRVIAHVGKLDGVLSSKST